MRTSLILLATLSACGLPQVDFVESYTLRICEHDLECGDAGQQRFDGILDVDDCVEITRPETYDWGRGCRYRPGQAVQCIADMETLTCPGGGGLAPLPASCDQVYVNCSDVPMDDDPADEGSEEEPMDEEPSDEPEDTDVAADDAFWD